MELAKKVVPRSIPAINTALNFTLIISKPYG